MRGCQIASRDVASMEAGAATTYQWRARDRFEGIGGVLERLLERKVTRGLSTLDAALRHHINEPREALQSRASERKRERERVRISITTRKLQALIRPRVCAAYIREQALDHGFQRCRIVFERQVGASDQGSHVVHRVLGEHRSRAAWRCRRAPTQAAWTR